MSADWRQGNLVLGMRVSPRKVELAKVKFSDYKTGRLQLWPMKSNPSKQYQSRANGSDTSVGFPNPLFLFDEEVLRRPPGPHMGTARVTVGSSC